MPFEVVLVNFVVRPSASQVLLSCAGHHLAHNTLILNDFTFINYFWFSSFITTHGRTPGYCLLWRFRFNVPCERSLKGFLHICFNFSKGTCKVKLSFISLFGRSSSPRDFHLELILCLPSIALSERTSSSQHSTLWASISNQPNTTASWIT